MNRSTKPVRDYPYDVFPKNERVGLRPYLRTRSREGYDRGADAPADTYGAGLWYNIPENRGEAR